LPVVTRSGRRFGLPWLAYAAFVIYGSLVPLDFRPFPLDEALRRFVDIPFLTLGAGSRADWIASGVLYFPLGALTALALLGWLARLPGLAMGLAWVFCAALAVGVEFLQLFFPPRTVSLNDLLAEWIGAALGVGARQGSCRLIHAANGCLSRELECVLTTESRSGFKVTASMGVQLRVAPDQRRGCWARPGWRRWWCWRCSPSTWCIRRPSWPSARPRATWPGFGSTTRAAGCWCCCAGWPRWRW
jgi:hypothetical protein